jgi:hypothetical protein
MIDIIDTNISRRQGLNREGPSEGGAKGKACAGESDRTERPTRSAKLWADEQKRLIRPSLQVS